MARLLNEPNPITSSSTKWQVQAVVGVGTLMATLDGSIVNIALPTIAHEFGVDLVAVSWVSIAYSLTMTSLLLIVGSLADRYGRARMYNAGMVIFTIGSLLCSMAWSIGALAGARVLQSIGGTMMVGNSAAVLTQTFPPKERGRTLGLNGTVVALGLSIGPTLGGILVSAFNWRSIFYVNLPIGVIGAILSYRLLREAPRAAPTHRFDYFGAALLVASLFALTMGLTQTEMLGWGSPVVIGLLALALVLAVGFVRVERGATHPLVRLGLFRNRLFAAANLSAMLSFLASNCYLFIMPFFLQTALALDPSKAGLVMSTVPATVFFVAAFSGWLSDRVDSVFLSSAGLIITTVGYLSLASLGVNASPGGVALRLVLVGLGTGIFQAPNTRAIMSTTPKSYLGIGSSMIALMRNLGSVVGLALGSSLFASQLASYLLRSDIVAAGAGATALGYRFAFRDVILLATVVVAAAIGASLVRGRGRGGTDEPETEEAGSAG